MNRFYENQFKKVALLMVMLLFGLSTAFAQQTQLRLVIECEGVVLVRDANTQQAVASIQGPTAPGDYALVSLASNQLIQLVTDGPNAAPPVPQFQIQGVEVMWWEFSNNYIPPAFPIWTVQNPATTQNLALQMGQSGSIRLVNVRFKVKDPGVTISDPGDISTITYTPVIIPITVTYPTFSLPNPYTGSGIHVDAQIENALGGNFPTGAQIIKVSLDGGLTNLLGAPVNIGGVPLVYLSEVLGITPALLEDEEGKTLNWEITVAGVTSPVTVPVKVTSIGFKVVDPLTQSFPGPFDISGLNVNCITEFANPSLFNITWADSQVVAISDFETCWNVPYFFEYAITYPSIVNLDTRIKNDAKMVVDVPLNALTSIDIYYDDVFVSTYLLSGAYSTFYLSAMLAGDGNPTSPNLGVQNSLMGHIGVDTWRFEIDDLQPGVYNIDLTNFAYLEGVQYAYDGESFELTVHPEPVVGFSFNGELAVTNSVFEYCYDEEVIVSLSEIWVGTAPFTISWSVEGPLGTTTATLSGVELDDILFNDLLPAGTYTVTITEITDDHGCEPSDYSPWIATVIVHPEPAVGFAFNGDIATTGEIFEYCYDETVTVTLGTVWSGTEPFDIAWTVNGIPATATNVYTLDELFSDLLDPGTYVVQITSIVDAFGCSPSTYVPYTATAVVHPEPELEVEVNDVIAHSQYLEFCYNDIITIDITGIVGTAPWTANWQVEGPTPFGTQTNTMTGSSGTWTYDLSLFPVGSYTLTITSLVDAKGCVATQTTLDTYTFYIEIHPEPVVNEIDMVYSFSDDLSSPVLIYGDLYNGYELCINSNVEYYYLGVDALDVDDVLEVNFLNPFYLNANTALDFFTWWEAKGVELGATGWQGHMWEIINGDEPQFYLVFDGTDYMLVDGLYYDFFGQTVHLKVNGNYPQGLYNYTGSVKSAEGCLSDVEVDIYFRHEPNANAGADFTVCNSASYQLNATPSVVGSTGLWTKTGGPGPVDFADDTDPHTVVTVEVAGQYEFTWTETNGICEDSDVVVVTFLKGTNADGYDLDPLADIDAVMGVPVVTKYTYHLPIPDVDADPNIIMDGLIHFEGGFPAGAVITGIARTATLTTTWFPVNPIAGNVGGDEYVLFSDLIGISNPLYNNELSIYNWVISYEGFDVVGVYTATISLVTYITKPTNFATDCYATLDSQSYTLSVDDAVITTPLDCLVVCYDAEEQDHELNFDISIAYPAINNVDVDDQITLDALLTIMNGNNLSGATLLWGYNAAALNASAIPITGAGPFYLSDIVGGSPIPISAHSGTDVWSIKIIGLDPGYYDLKVEAVAFLDIFSSLIPKRSTVAVPQVPPLVNYLTDFTTHEYKYAEESLCFNVVGSLEVSIDPISDIETVTGAPIIVPINVNYGDISGEIIDASVMSDALISFDGTLPATAKIVELKYGATTIATNYSLALADEVLLSDVVLSGGFPAPNPLNGHANNSTDTWTAVFAGIDNPGTYTITVQGIAYVGTYAAATCVSVTAEEEFTVTYENLVIDADDPAIVCEGTDVSVTFDLEFPAISIDPINPDAIGFDVRVAVDQVIPAGVTVDYDIAGGFITGTFGFPAGLPALTEFYLGSHIAGLPFLLNELGTEAFPIVLTISGLTALPVPDMYGISNTPVAVLGGVYYNLGANGDWDIDVEVYEVPDATIGGVTSTFSGGTETYSVAVHPYGVSPYPTYSWSSVPGSPQVIINDPLDPTTTVDFVWPYTGFVDLTVVVDNGVCSDTYTLTIEVLPNLLVGQVKYYNAGETPMPSPFNTNYNGMTVPDFFYVSLVDTQFDIEMGDPYNDALEVKKVEEYYGEDGHPLLTDGVYEAAFAFDYNLDPAAEYRVLVWDGGYFEESLGDGQLMHSWTWNNWDGVNGTDGLMVEHMVIGNDISVFPNMSHIGNPYSDFNINVADANYNGTLTGLDALLVKRRAIGLIQKYPNNKRNFEVAGIFVPEIDFNTNNTFGVDMPSEFSAPKLENYVASSFATKHFYYSGLDEVENYPLIGYRYLNIYYNAVGDVTANYIPVYGGFKAEPTLELIYEGELAVSSGQEVTIPIVVDRYADLGALSLGFTYRNDLIEVIGTNYGEDFAYFNHEQGILNIAWFAIEGMNFNEGDAIALITVRVLGEITADTRLFELTNFTELADRKAQVIEGVNLKASSLSTLTPAISTFAVSNNPNPFRDATTITYDLTESGAVTMVIFNKMGQAVKSVVSEYQSAGTHKVTVTSSDLNGPGVYYYKLEVKGESKDYSSNNSMILIR